MGIERMHPPRYWRMRAEEFRTKADNCDFEQTRRSLRKVAATYEALAKRAEQIRTVQDAAECAAGRRECSSRHSSLARSARTCSAPPAGWASRASSPNGAIAAILPAEPGNGSRSRTGRTRRCRGNSDPLFDSFRSQLLDPSSHGFALGASPEAVQRS